MIDGRADGGLTKLSRTYSRRSLHGQVAHDLGLSIVRGTIAAGKVLPNEETFSNQLNVSRTALREAIKVLAAKGLVESRPKTGTRIRPRSEWNMLDPDVLAWQFAASPDEAFIGELFEVRQMLEPSAAAIAAVRRTNADLATLHQAYADMETAPPGATVAPDLRFHQGILDATGNEFLCALGTLIETALAGSFQLSSYDINVFRRCLPGHKAVLDAIVARQPSEARARMNTLLDDSASDVHHALERKRRHSSRAAS